MKMQYIYSSTEDSEAVLIFEHNNAGLKKGQGQTRKNSTKTYTPEVNNIRKKH
jgi:hypothetical protein